MEKKRIGGRCNFVEDQNQIYQSEGNTNLTQLLIKAVKILFRLISRYGKGNLISKTARYLQTSIHHRLRTETPILQIFNFQKTTGCKNMS